MERVLENLRNLAVQYATGAETPTAIPRLSIWLSPCKTEQTPILFEPKLYLVLQGAKRMILGGKSLVYTAGSYSVSSVGLPFTTQVIEASSTKPYLGLELRLDSGAVSNLLLEIPGKNVHQVPPVALAPITDDISEPLYRLLRLSATPKDVPILAPLIEREIHYRVMQGVMADTLRQTVQINSRFAQIKRAVEWICSNAVRTLSVTELAESVSMSATSFHRHFKAVTSMSPLLYQKHIRLLEAQKLLRSSETKVTAVAFEVGYASSSQFSREYKQMFGHPPRDDLGMV